MARTVPVSVIESPGLSITSAWQNAQVKALTDFLTAPPVFQAYATTAQSIPASNTMTPLNLDTEVFDSDGGHSTVTNTSRYTATVPSVYLVIGSVGWPANASGDRRIQIAKNSTFVPGSGGSYDPSQSVTAGQVTSTIVTLNGTTDYVEVHVAQSSAGPLNTNVGTVYVASMSVFWISR